MRNQLTIDDLPALNATLSGNDLKIVVDLMTMADRVEDDGTTYFQSPVDDIARRTDLAAATVYKRLRAMTAAGQLQVMRDWTRGRGGAAKVYAVAF